MSRKKDQAAESMKNEGETPKDNAGYGDNIIKSLIECPVCFEIPLPPIYLCKKGHIVCNSCQSRTEMCPLCRDEYTNTRSFFAEEMLQRCSLNCRYADQGCNVSIKGSELFSHLITCDYRPYKCIECNGKCIDFVEYQDHIEKFHKCNGGKKGNYSFVLMTFNFTQPFTKRIVYLFPQYYLKCFGKFFLVRVFALNSFINAWVCLVGEKSECDKYRVKIKLKISPDIKLNWIGPVRNFRESPSQDIYLKGGCLSVPTDQIRNTFSTTDSIAEWIYYVKIVEKGSKLSKPDESESTEESKSSSDSDDGSLLSLLNEQ